MRRPLALSLSIVVFGAVCCASAGALHETISGRLDALSPWVCGVHLGGNWGSNVEGIKLLPRNSLEFPASLGANWIGISVAMTVTDSMDSTVEPAGDDEEIPAFKDTDLRNFIRALRDWGFHVYMTLAFENMGDGPRGKSAERWQLGAPNAYAIYDNIAQEFWPWDPAHPQHESFVSQFFSSYSDVAVHYAKLASEEGVELFSLGTETDPLFVTRPATSKDWPKSYREQLTAMVQEVRAVYDGLVTYDMHYGALTERIPPNMEYLWGDLGLDVIGISAYFHLFSAVSQTTPSASSCEGRWDQIFSAYLSPLASRYPDKPLLFLELGIGDHRGTSAQPIWNQRTRRETADLDGNGLDDGEEEQANVYDGLFRAVADNPGILDGIFYWGEMFGSHYMWSNWHGGCYRDMSIRGRPAEEIVRGAFTQMSGGVLESPSVSPVVSMDSLLDVPYSIAWPSGATPGYYRDGVTALSDSEFWGRQGSHVQGIKAALEGDRLILVVDLREGDMPGLYRYEVTLQSGRYELLLNITPEDGCLSLVDRTDGAWIDVATLCDSAYQEGERMIVVAFPVPLFRGGDPFLERPTWTVDLTLDYRECERRELFFLPGRGQLYRRE